MILRIHRPSSKTHYAPTRTQTSYINSRDNAKHTPSRTVRPQPSPKNDNKTQNMKTVIQRVKTASVHTDGALLSSIGKGFLILLGIENGDTDRDIASLTRKITHLRVFEDDQGKMNRDIGDSGGSILLVSQFTLCAQCRHGNRPAFTAAMPPEQARSMVEDFGRALEQNGIPVKYGRFGAMMDVSLVNDGPVTIILESRDGAILR